MDWAEQWKQAVLSSLSQLGSRVGDFVPSLLGMLVILVLGYLVSKLLQRISRVLLWRVGFDKASEKVGIADTMRRIGVKSSPSHIVGKLVFWLFMLTFILSAAETLGLENVTQTIDSFVAYVPNVIGAAVIAVVGLLLAHFVRDVVRSGAESLGLEYAQTIARAAHAVLVVVVASLAFSQLQIETALINRVVEIFLMASGAMLALSLGLGTRDTARNFMAGTCARDTLVPGTKIVFGDRAGTVKEVGVVSTKIETPNGKVVLVPNGQLTDMVLELDGATTE